MELVLVAEDEAGALQETRGDLLFANTVENRESPLYLALSTPEANFLQVQYIAWLALPEECRSLRTEVALACKLGLNRTPLWRCKQGPHLRINERAGGFARYHLISHLPIIYGTFARKAGEGSWS